MNFRNDLLCATRQKLKLRAAAGRPGMGWSVRETLVASITLHQQRGSLLGPHKDFDAKLIKDQPNELKENSLSGACCASENSCHVYLFKFNGIFVVS